MKKLFTKKIRRRVTIFLFIIFSAVLFINNTNQLLSNWLNLSYGQIEVIAWVGILLSLFYALFKYMDGKF